MSIEAIISLKLSQKLWQKGVEFAELSVELYTDPDTGVESEVFAFAAFDGSTVSDQQQAMNDFMAWDFSRQDGLVKVLPIYSEFREGHYFLEGYFDRVSELVIHDFVSTAKEFWAAEEEFIQPEENSNNIGNPPE